MSQQNSIKSGFLTSEFYVAVAGGISGLLLSLGYLEPQQATALSEAIVAVIGGILTIVSTIGYIYSRIKVKQASVESSTNNNQVLSIPGVEEPDQAPRTVPVKQS